MALPSNSNVYIAALARRVKNNSKRVLTVSYGRRLENADMDPFHRDDSSDGDYSPSDSDSSEDHEVIANNINTDDKISQENNETIESENVVEPDGKVFWSSGSQQFSKKRKLQNVGDHLLIEGSTTRRCSRCAQLKKKEVGVRDIAINQLSETDSATDARTGGVKPPEYSQEDKQTSMKRI
ncbi:hypothetical protein FQA39_LY07708 [Lamprigera yunnana]|nr:hypothetical protein FQA39_LY07708 [Lamprigera yunnana]